MLYEVITIYSLLAKGKSYSNQRDYAKALVAFKKAYSSLQPDTSPSIKGIVLNHLGGALIETGNYTEAIPVCHSALLVNISCNNRIETTVSHMNLGDAVWKSGKITAAKQHCVITSYSIHYTKLYEAARSSSRPSSISMVWASSSGPPSPAATTR